MGQSTNALLYYGFTFADPEDGEPPPWADFEDEDGEVDEEDWLCARLGGPTPPEVEYSEETSPLYLKYWDAKRGFIEALPIAIGIHCSCNYPMHFICIKGTLTTAYRGGPKQLDDLGEDRTWAATLFDYCNRLGIEPEQPSWELASLWC
jgi:hypothetical protein